MKKILVLGGSGFVGRSVVEALSKQGHSLTVPSRDCARARHLLLLPTVELVEADINDPMALSNLVRGHDAVINLVGILAGNFENAHVNFPAMLADACVQAGVSRLVQMSALGAEITAPSQYLQSRARGEQAVWSVAKAHAGLAVTVLRPSVIFGVDDNFLNMLNRLTALFPVIPLGSPKALFQPIWVEDVARAVAHSIDSPSARETESGSFDLVGPRVYQLRELLLLTLTLTGRRRWVIELGPALSRLQALAFEFPPFKWFGAALGVTLTRDNVLSMQVPNTSAEAFPAIFGTPATLEATAATYLRGVAGRTRYQRYRECAGR